MRTTVTVFEQLISQDHVELKGELIFSFVRWVIQLGVGLGDLFFRVFPMGVCLTKDSIWISFLFLLRGLI